MEVSGQPQTPAAFSLENESLVHIEYEGGWAGPRALLETFREEKNLLFLL
jgi:hypothetical protein